MKEKIRIGTGAGHSGDRIGPAVDLARSGELDYLVFECLAERTIAQAQHRRIKDPNTGYDLLLEDRLRQVLPHCAANETKVVTNMGAANPMAGGRSATGILHELNLPDLIVGVVLGDDILPELRAHNFAALRGIPDISRLSQDIISANAYLGANPIVEALQSGADIVICGRTCDPSLFLAPMMLEFGWREDDWGMMGKGIAVGHLLECGAQVTGGYFADPGHKDVEGLDKLGFPIAEVYENGEAVISKLPDSGGEVSERTVKEQLLYEVHDPGSYITADGIADFTKVRFKEVGEDRVRFFGGGGRQSPDELKVSVGYRNGFTGEAQISYGGEGALQRAQLAARIIGGRLANLKLALDELRFDFIGSNSLWPEGSSSQQPHETRLRAMGTSRNRDNVEKLCREIEALYTNGPAGGGGVSKNIEERVSVISGFIPRKFVKPFVRILEV